MPKSPELSEFERGRIIGMWEASLSEREIESKTGHKKTTVHDTIKRYRDENRVESSPRSGRPPALSDRDKRGLTKIIKEERSQTLLQITEKFNETNDLSLSSSTVRKYLHELGYFGRAGVRKPLVSEKNRKDRLAWCRSRRNWIDEWKLIIWSDESSFEIFQSDAYRWVWRKPKEKYDVDCLIPTVKHGKESVMIWGCFVDVKLGPLVVVDGTINSEKYRNLLQDNLIPFLNSLDDDLAYIFQDDNARPHRAEATTKWKDENLISSLPWPAQSPDLNPIEHLWDALERKVRGRKPYPKNKCELIVALKEEWDKIEPEILEKLIDSMPRRIESVINSKGYPTEY